MILRKRLITRYQLRKRSMKEDLTAVHIFLSIIYLSKSTMQPIEQWDLFDFVAMRRLQQPNNHQLKLINTHRLK